ncbi:hypothetical protein A3D80_02735 [Candidatus Roizmanbacteria bacterium RIFCSPHIGHO2_02_FULL_40_13b]|nr:MAG: hypothetical protein A3D80_02735 [Candidatus Roizmanbacteria bacterium RIFCSPHIGHO2_02_FULL_40_13b]OGK49266.1 MAG: hypothetical protein A3A56_00565 [Candidatus Roizmanbacteria bacterium RIFCSPLOWO2_01_FULL_40_32]
MSSPEFKPTGHLRGYGRFLQALHENGIDSSNMAFWSPFEPPELKTSSQSPKSNVLVIFDVIPLKFPSHFPAGIRGNIQLWKNKRALAKDTSIITISEHAKADIVKYLGVPEEKIRVIYPPIGKIFVEGERGRLGDRGGQRGRGEDGEIQAEQDKYIVYVGDVNWNKNLPNLAKAIKLGNIACVFVGNSFPSSSPPLLGPTPSPHPCLPAGRPLLPASWRTSHPWQESYKKFLEIANNNPKFIFKGYVSDEKLISLYKNAVCNVLVSQDEGFGYSYVEAASQGTPSVLSETGIFMETGGDSALFADPDKPQDIADKIKTLVEDKEKRESLGKKAKERVLEMFSPEKFKLAHQALLADAHTDPS